MHELENFLVVGIGASAGGLEACRALIDALPPQCNTAFILIQHLAPGHESMMVELLKGRSTVTVEEAKEGALISPSHFYIIPPGTYLSVERGTLHLTRPPARGGARLPFDFFLHSLAAAYGDRAVCVVLSGTGGDGSLGLETVRKNRGFVIAQDPDEAGYDGMPRSAISTGAVDIVLPVREIPAAIENYGATPPNHQEAVPPDARQDILPEVIDLLRATTVYDFAPYKSGTLERRIERRMALSAIKACTTKQYIEFLRSDPNERKSLAQDILINVTSFFRDPEVFEYLAQKLVPEIVQRHTPGEPLRIWIAGCSTGEETYSLLMLFCEEIGAKKRNVKLQIFASDVDPDALSVAREGFYPKTVESNVSSDRLARFFSEEERGYRILPELRAQVIFSVQDLLTDPPFSKLDMISCRNLLIYLRPEAQEKVISLFHFALRKDGVLLLGSSETAGNISGRFEVISKTSRLYRHVGQGRPGAPGFSIGGGAGTRFPERRAIAPIAEQQASLAELCRRLVIASYAPAALLINRKHECLYSVGPTDRYMRLPTGPTTNDLLSLARPSISAKLRAGIQKAIQENGRVVISGGQLTENGQTISFSIAVEPVTTAGEQLLLICFIDDFTPEESSNGTGILSSSSRIEELERELDTVRTELQTATRNLEIAKEDHKTINEEALSVSEEYQSTNEELLSSKEELQSLNEELTSLNSQLQETLECQRTTANDLQNVLYSTDAATLFLDTDLKIRFFTPATRSLFCVIPSDVGRPLADLNSLAADSHLLSDAKKVLQTQHPVEAEIEAGDGTWYTRRVLPYRTQENDVQGVVITFSDITDLRHVAEALEASKRHAELATISKSRFLAAASHDLRQPLQTLVLLHDIMEKTIGGANEKKLVVRLDETLSVMSGMLNTLLDINQIETGNVHVEMENFAINNVLDRLRDEYSYYASPPSLKLRILPCTLFVYSDARLLEQMIRNLLSNAFKYTRSGKILLGCRRRGEILRIEIWDTGIGISEAELEAIFEEYYQLGNTARERERGLGLGLAIVRRIAELLGHAVNVRSQLGSGSVFSIDVGISSPDMTPQFNPRRTEDSAGAGEATRRFGTILVVEDDSDVRELLHLLLEGEGHRVVVARDGIKATALIQAGEVQPDIVLADYNLPNGLNGLEVIDKTRRKFGREIPAIVLTGDVSTDALQRITSQNCVKLNKPVKPKELKSAIQRLLPVHQATVPSLRRHVSDVDADSPPQVIFVVDDNPQVRATIREALEKDGRIAEDYESGEAFLAAYRPGRGVCLLIDAYLPGMDGVTLLQHLHSEGHDLPAIMITGNSDVAVAVQAMKAGALDFIEKPIRFPELIASIDRAVEQSKDASEVHARHERAVHNLAGLTPRQRTIMEMVLTGQANKNIAVDLNISQRTVEHHRAAIMKKTGSKSLPALARLALAAGSNS